MSCCVVLLLTLLEVRPFALDPCPSHPSSAKPYNNFSLRTLGTGVAGVTTISGAAFFLPYDFLTLAIFDFWGDVMSANLCNAFRIFSSVGFLPCKLCLRVSFGGGGIWEDILKYYFVLELVQEFGSL